MTNEIIIDQVQEKGNNGQQIGVQNVYNGLSPTEVCQMAFTMFREYFPKLREELYNDLQRMVEEELKNIPKENIVPPTARIAVPTLQKASITEEVEIRELYARLLANSMNKVLKDGVHPSFVEIINQLTPDEAKILRYLKFKATIPTITLRYENPKSEGFDVIKNFSNIGELTNCEHPLDVNRYFDNLIRLGLIERPTLFTLINKELYEPLKKHEYILKYAMNASNRVDEYRQAVFKESYVCITGYGKNFCNICIPQDTLVTVESNFSEVRDNEY